jgi:hypothetical protein
MRPVSHSGSRFPSADGTAVGGLSVKAAAVGTLLFVIVLIPPHSFYRVTAVCEEFIEDIVTGTVG